MPRVPTERTGISLDVPAPSYNVGTAGIVGESLAKVGQVAFQGATSILDDIKQQEATQAANAAHQKDLIDIKKYSLELGARSSGGYVLDAEGKPQINPDTGQRVTMAEEYQDWADKRFRTRQTELPSKLAQDLYIKNTSPLYSDEYQTIQNKQMISMVEASSHAIEQSSQEMRSFLSANPNQQTAYAGIDHLTSSIMDGVGKAGKQGLWNADQAQERIMKQQQAVSSDLFGGALARVQSLNYQQKGQGVSEARQWLNTLYNQDPDSKRRQAAGLKTLSDMLNPDEKQKLIREFSHAMHLSERADLGDLDKQISATYQALKDAKPGEKIDIAPLVGRIRGVSPTLWTDFEKGEKIVHLFAADRFNKFAIGNMPWKSDEQLTSWIDSSADQIKTVAKQMVGPNEKAIAGAIDAADIKKDLTVMAKQYIEKRNKDFMGYTKEQDKEIGNIFKSVDFNNASAVIKAIPAVDAAISKARGVTRYGAVFGNNTVAWRPLSEEDSKLWANAIANPPDTATAGLMIYEMRKMRNFTDVMDRMIQDKNLPPQYRIVALQPERVAIQDTISMLGKQGEAIDKLFDDRFVKAGKFSETDFKASADPAMHTFIETTLRRSGMNKVPKEEVVAISGLIETKAKDLMLKSYAVNPKEAWNLATSSLLGRHIHLNSVRNMGFVIPKVIDGQEITPSQSENITRTVRGIWSEDGLTRLGIDVPKDASGNTNIPDSEFINQILKTGAPVVSQHRDQDGDAVVQFTYRDVLRNTTQYVKKGGKILSIKLRDAERKGQAVMDEYNKKSWLEKLLMIKEY